MTEGIKQQLHADHDRLNGLFQELVDAVEGADQPTLQQVWTEFEGGLLTHFEAEERYLFPVLADAEPDEVRALKQEHARVRGLVADLGVKTDLHMLRKEVVDLLLDALREHAAREDRLLYAWADEHASEETRTSLLRHLRKEREKRGLAAAE